jgi:hypothetical protein
MVLIRMTGMRKQLTRGEVNTKYLEQPGLSSPFPFDRGGGRQFRPNFLILHDWDYHDSTISPPYD